MILGLVNPKRNPFIYLNNMGKVMTSAQLRAGRAFALVALVAFPVGSGARAETGAWAESAHAKARLVSAVAATGAEKRVKLGLEIRLDPGWKTYWRAPGEGGMPPRFDWSGSANVASVAIAWPAPKRFEIGGLESLGYADHVILPLDVTLAHPGEPLAVRLSLHYAVCREICMLVEAQLALDLPDAAVTQFSSNAEAIARFQSLVPRAGAEHGWYIAGLRRLRLGRAGADGRDVLLVEVESRGTDFAAPDLIIEAPGLRFGKAMRKPGSDAKLLRFAAPMQAIGAAPPEQPEVVITLIDGARAGELRARLEPARR